MSYGLIGMNAMRATSKTRHHLATTHTHMNSRGHVHGGRAADEVLGLGGAGRAVLLNHGVGDKADGLLPLGRGAVEGVVQLLGG